MCTVSDTRITLPVNAPTYELAVGKVVVSSVAWTAWRNTAGTFFAVTAYDAHGKAGVSWPDWRDVPAFLPRPPAAWFSLVDQAFPSMPALADPVEVAPAHTVEPAYVPRYQVQPRDRTKGATA